MKKPMMMDMKMKGAAAEKKGAKAGKKKGDKKMPAFLMKGKK